VGWCFLVNALTYPAVLAGLLLMRPAEMWPSPRSERAPGQLRSGLRYLAGEPVLRAPIVVMTLVAVFGYQMEVTLPLLAEETFGAGASGFTVLYAAMSAGAAAGGLMMARRNAASLRMVVANTWVFAAGLLALALAPHLLVAAVVAVPAGFGAITVLSGAATVVQVHADPRRRGLTVSIVSMIFLGSRPVGSPLAGAVADAWGPRTALAVAAALCAVTAAVGAVMARRHSTGAGLAAAPERDAGRAAAA
jgi:predicted MFS family arabinose efflux permease